MIHNNSQKFSNIFYCEKCHYNAKRKSDYNKHLQSKKHKDTNDTLNDTKKLSYICSCGKTYKYHSGFYRHKKTCIFKECNININNDNKDVMKELVIKLINENNEIKNSLLKENQDLREQINELIPKIGNNNNNTINNKNKFNINVFLNEKCKDALSMDEFIDKIEISMKNLLTTKEKGQINGITNIIMENMNKLSLYERPLHCTDKKRETLYIKNNEWIKDENKTIINKALKNVERQQMQNINVWLEQHPNYMKCTKEQEEFAKLLSESGKSVDEGREKIVKNVCDNVFLEKEHC